jgi:hypothetical protein
MSIRVVCSNGHDLKIKEKYSGMIGVCPVCRVPIKVPEVDVFAEDAIMDVLQPHQSGLSGLSLALPDFDRKDLGETVTPRADLENTSKKCDRCREKVPQAAHVCPYCHTYMPNFFWM